MKIKKLCHDINYKGQWLVDLVDGDDVIINATKFEKILCLKFKGWKLDVNRHMAISEQLIYIREEIVKPFYYLFGDEIKKFYDVLQLEFNPLDNYDKNSTITTTDNNRTSEQFGTTRTSTNATNTSTSTSNDKTIDKVATIEDLIESSIPIDNASINDNIYNGSDTQISNSSTTMDGVKTVGTGSTTVTEHTRGNIGVTTSTQMRDSFVLSTFESAFYNIVSDLFCEYCLHL